MKTPREILLARHRGAESKLDDIRNKALAELARGSAASFGASAPGRTGSTKPQPWLARLWQELVWPHRRAWVGMATVWFLLALLNLGDAPGSSRAVTARRLPSAQAMLLLAEQQRVLAELLQTAPAPPAEPAKPTPAPPPRSERRTTIRMA